MSTCANWRAHRSCSRRMESARFVPIRQTERVDAARVHSAALRNHLLFAADAAWCRRLGEAAPIGCARHGACYGARNLCNGAANVASASRDARRVKSKGVAALAMALPVLLSGVPHRSQGCFICFSYRRGSTSSGASRRSYAAYFRRPVLAVADGACLKAPGARWQGA